MMVYAHAYRSKVQPITQPETEYLKLPGRCINQAN